ncbi:DUF2726 domain-containing protein [Sphingomonas sp. PB4P5]|uniref:DUF2726 domain-containing protein n=1 Tax=Parasphingomonas puruogangriensis TaxID=3096155 RepID=UPI002FCB4F6C
MDAFTAWVMSDWPLIAALSVCFLTGAASERAWRRWQLKLKYAKRRTTWHSSSSSAVAKPAPIPNPVKFDPAEQLRAVERSPFTSRNLLNKGELRLLDVLDAVCSADDKGWRVMAQVSLGEVLASPEEPAFRAINTKRVDFLIINAKGAPQYAVELQGSGHHLGAAATRDAIKKEALRRAGIGFVEVLPGDTPLEVRANIAKFARQVPPDGMLTVTRN